VVVPGELFQHHKAGFADAAGVHRPASEAERAGAA
jgi:hypothetical protein